MKDDMEELAKKLMDHFGVLEKSQGAAMDIALYGYHVMPTGDIVVIEDGDLKKVGHKERHLS